MIFGIQKTGFVVQSHIMPWQQCDMLNFMQTIIGLFFLYELRTTQCF